jgi:Mg2+/Co2+ transporter CorB
MIVIVVTIIVLMTIAAFFSAAETALTAASKPLMHQLNEEGDQRAGTVTRLLDQRERLISTALLGNNVVNILASALTTSVMIEAFGNEGVVYATVIMTFLMLSCSHIFTALSMSFRTGSSLLRTNCM